MSNNNYCLPDLDSLATFYAGKMEKGKKIGLIGVLGAGKTKFTSVLAKKLGIESSISSPTFTVMQTYGNKGKRLLHVDLYRVYPQDRETIDQIIEEIDKYKYVVVEWADKIKTIYDKLDVVISFSHARKENERIITEVKKK